MKKEKLPILYVVIPCYNEEEVLEITYPDFTNILNKMIKSKLISDNSKIMYVNDGSKDKTWDIIGKLCKNKNVCGISLSRNRGHQNALLAGLMEAKEKSDITISIDCDGQDDINVMEDMVKAYIKGADIVYGVRSSRKKDSFFKRFTAVSFYKLLNKMGVEVIFNHADYRLVSKRVLDEFSEFKEVNLFLRGMFPLVGFNSTVVYYERDVRKAGKTHYPLKKMLQLAFDGITSLSIKPLRMFTTIGLITSFISFCFIIYTIVAYFIGNTVAGWASMTSIICFIGGIQLIGIGVLGEYIGKTYMEVKARPRFIISEKKNIK
jgi:glycosyltransferase involved in cell wall biosynthesis